MVQQDAAQFLVRCAAQPQLEEEAPAEILHFVFFRFDQGSAHAGRGFSLVGDGHQQVSVVLPAGGLFRIEGKVQRNPSVSHLDALYEAPVDALPKNTFQNLHAVQIRALQGSHHLVCNGDAVALCHLANQALSRV